MKMLTSEEIKSIELEILLKFQSICSKLGLRYYLSGGTLLGAIRHKGFIPWDDDIDLAMPRPDFNKLCEYSKTYCDETYKFIFFDQKGNELPFAKFQNIQTKVIIDNEEDEMQDHLWIDIIPMDGLPENYAELKNIYKKAKFYRRIINICNTKFFKGTSLPKKIGKTLLKPFALLYTKKKAMKNLNCLAKLYPYETSAYVGAISWGMYGINERMLKKEVDQTISITFENEEFLTFSCWDFYLTNLYKNYMVLPPVEKRVNHNIKAWKVKV